MNGNTHTTVTDLLAQLGGTVTAYIARSRSRAVVWRWATPPGESSHAEPTIDVIRRLEAAHTTLLLIRHAENELVARSWLVSANPRLDGLTPAEFIRNGNYPAVHRAARAFITDVYHA